MENEVHIEIKSVYGEEKAYPVNAQAKRLADLVGTKTLTHSALSKAKSMGFIVVEMHRGIEIRRSGSRELVAA